MRGSIKFRQMGVLNLFESSTSFKWGQGSTCFSRGSVPVFLRRHRTICDFPVCPDPLYPTHLDPPMSIFQIIQMVKKTSLIYGRDVIDFDKCFSVTNKLNAPDFVFPFGFVVMLYSASFFIEVSTSFARPTVLMFKT